MNRKILDIYSQYQIPPNLQRHQLEVTAVGRYVCDHWIGEHVDKELITRTLLLHDMGNILKFKRPFMGEIEKDAVHWEQVQQDFEKKYGSSVHPATMVIANEVDPTQKASQLIEAMRHLWEEDGEVRGMEARICEYADCCVTPNGIEGFETRVEDLKKRYHGGEETQVIENIRHNADSIEKNVDIIDLSVLNRIDFSKEIQELSVYEL